MSFLLSDCKELGFDGLVAVNGGCNIGSTTIKAYSSECSSYVSPPLPPKTKEEGHVSTEIIPPKNILGVNYIPPVSKYATGNSDPRGYWATLEAQIKS